MKQVKKVKAGSVTFGEKKLPLIAGPCVIESRSSALRHAEKISRVAKSLGTPFVFKASYDKANRTSIASFRGLGIDEGLQILAQIKKLFKIPVLSDVHSAEEIKKAGKVLDIIQIPAFLSRQTDLLVAAGASGKVVNIKKGQFLSPGDIEHAVKKVKSTGNQKILITERGTSFGYNHLINDFKAIPAMQSFGFPVIFDGTHSVQMPGGKGSSSGGAPQFIPTLTRAAIAAGVDGLFLEVHENPKKALSDSANSIHLKDLKSLIKSAKLIREAYLKSKGV